MIPENMKKQLEKQQTDKVKNRGKKDDGFDFNKYKPKPGKCVMCQRENVLIVKSKHVMCNMCFHWCYNYIKRSHGYYHEKFISTAIIEFRKPIKCKFFDICQGIIPRLNENDQIRSNRNQICKRCYPIYRAGREDANRKRRNIKHHQIGVNR